MIALRLLAIFFSTHIVSADVPHSTDDSARTKKIEQIFTDYQRAFRDAPMITANDLIALQSDPKVVTVDVRSRAEQEVSIIPGAISKEQFESNEAIYRNHRIVVYCTIGLRSGLYTLKLKKKGYRAYNLKGGVLAWADAHQSFVNRQGRTNRVHVYGAKWNLLPSDYEAVW